MGVPWASPGPPMYLGVGGFAPRELRQQETFWSSWPFLEAPGLHLQSEPPAELSQGSLLGRGHVMGLWGPWVFMGGHSPSISWAEGLHRRSGAPQCPHGTAQVPTGFGLNIRKKVRLGAQAEEESSSATVVGEDSEKVLWASD